MSTPSEAIGIWFELIDYSIDWSSLYLSPNEMKYIGKETLAPGRRLEFALTRHVLRVELKRRSLYNGPDIEFKKDPQGKLSVRDGSYGNFHFSISHCKGASLILIAPQFNVGCDIETLHRNIKSQELLEKRICSEDEWDFLESLEVDKRKLEFLKIWTRKESYSKMTGRGLAEDFKTFSVLKDHVMREGGEANLVTYDRSPFVLSLAAAEDHIIPLKKMDLQEYLGDECLLKF